MIKNLLPRLAGFVANRTKAPTVVESIQAALVQMLAYTVIIGGLLYLASISSDLQPAPTKEDKAQVEKEQDQQNWPEYSTHRKQASKVCGGKVVPSGEGVTSDWVIVVKESGKMVRMTLNRALRLNNQKNTDVWVIGICKKDLLDRVVVKGVE